MEEKNYEAIIEAILFTMGESVELDKIANAIELDKQETKKKIEALRQKYEQEERGIQIIELDGAYQMCTKNEMYEYLDCKPAEEACPYRRTVRNLIHHCL